MVYKWCLHALLYPAHYEYSHKWCTNGVCMHCFTQRVLNIHTNCALASLFDCYTWLASRETDAVSEHVLCTPCNHAPTDAAVQSKPQACVFSCNLTLALSAEWPGSLRVSAVTLYCLFSICSVKGSVWNHHDLLLASVPTWSWRDLRILVAIFPQANTTLDSQKMGLAMLWTR